MAPRQTNTEYLASLEAKLAEDKAKAEAKIAAATAATQAKIDAAKAKDEERTKTRIEKLGEQIATAKTSVEKAKARLAKLEAEQAELTKSDEPELPVDEQVDDERTEQPALVEAGKGNRRAKPDAA